MGGINCNVEFPPDDRVDSGGEASVRMADWTARLFGAYRAFAAANEAVEGVVVSENRMPSLALEDLSKAKQALSECATELESASETCNDLIGAWHRAIFQGQADRNWINAYQEFNSESAREAWVADGLIPNERHVWDETVQALRGSGELGFFRAQRPRIEELCDAIGSLADSYEATTQLVHEGQFQAGLRRLQVPSTPLTAKSVRLLNDLLLAQTYMCLIAYSATSAPGVEEPMSPESFSRALKTPVIL